MAQRSSREISSSQKFKVRFPLDPREEQGFKTESLWAEKSGPNQYRILNSPFFASESAQVTSLPPKISIEYLHSRRLCPGVGIRPTGFFCEMT
jgi:hypothetical protein